jgi:hypothetical protein
MSTNDGQIVDQPPLRFGGVSKDFHAGAQYLTREIPKDTPPSSVDSDEVMELDRVEARL